MLERIVTQRVHLKKALHREHLGHCIGDGRAGGKYDTASFVSRLDVLNFEKQIECALGGSLRQTGNPRHLCDIEQILESLCLIDEEAVDSEFFKCERVVLLLVGRERFKLRS